MADKDLVSFDTVNTEYTVSMWLKVGTAFYMFFRLQRQASKSLKLEYMLLYLALLILIVLNKIQYNHIPVKLEIRVRLGVTIRRISSPVRIVKQH